MIYILKAGLFLPAFMFCNCGLYGEAGQYTIDFCSASLSGLYAPYLLGETKNVAATRFYTQKEYVIQKSAGQK
jgi:hypothetical protein